MATDEQIGTADLLGLIAPPFRIVYGPDFILSRRAPGLLPVAGATVWLQNPTTEPMPVSVLVGERRERIHGTLAPLEVGVLSVPVSPKSARHGRELQFVIAGGPTTAPRVRAVTKGHLARGATMKGIAEGLAGLAFGGVGRFTVAHVGDDVANPFIAKWELEGVDAAVVAAETTWTRIWALPAWPPATFTHEAPATETVQVPRTWAKLVLIAATLVVPATVVNALKDIVGGAWFVALVALAVLMFALIWNSLRTAFPNSFRTETMGPLIGPEGDGVERAT
jgi:hypothetical protein